MNLRAAATANERCSAAEWKVRVDLAACYRLVELFGLSDLVFNHITAKVPGDAKHFAPGQRMHSKDVKSQPGASEYAPGHLPNKDVNK